MIQQFSIQLINLVIKVIDHKNEASMINFFNQEIIIYFNDLSNEFSLLRNGVFMHGQF